MTPRLNCSHTCEERTNHTLTNTPGRRHQSWLRTHSLASSAASSSSGTVKACGGQWGGIWNVPKSGWLPAFILAEKVPLPTAGWPLPCRETGWHFPASSQAARGGASWLAALLERPSLSCFSLHPVGQREGLHLPCAPTSDPRGQHRAAVCTARPLNAEGGGNSDPRTISFLFPAHLLQIQVGPEPQESCWASQVAAGGDHCAGPRR